MVKFLGVYENKVLLTFVIDVIVFVSSLLLFLHYRNQAWQVETSLKLKGQFKFQAKIKFHHVTLFRENYYGYLYATFLVYFVATLAFQTLITVVLALMQLCLLYLWSCKRKLASGVFAPVPIAYLKAAIRVS